MSGHAWSDFDRFYPAIDKYMPRRGEGETMASQICTAVNRLVFRWFNSGDVFDNTYYLNGWVNDISSCANWLGQFADCDDILDRIKKCTSGNDYEDLLYDLCCFLIDNKKLKELNQQQKTGSIYDCPGKYKYR